MTTTSEHIDALLDQVAIAIADGDNEKAAHILPGILQSGDDVQRLMAESYLMQLDALLMIEQEEQPITTDLNDDKPVVIQDEPDLIDDKPVAMQEEPDFIDYSPEVETNQVALDANKQQAHETFIDEISSSKPIADEPTLLNINVDKHITALQEAQINKDETVDINSVINHTILNEQTEKQVRNTPANNLLEETQPTTTSTPVTEASNATPSTGMQSSTQSSNYSNKSKDSDQGNTDKPLLKVTQTDETQSNKTSVSITPETAAIATSSNSQDNDEALKQIELLIADNEIETAELLLQNIAGSGNTEQNDRIKQLYQEIELGSSATDASVVNSSLFNNSNTESQLLTSDSVLDEIFDENYQGFFASRDDFTAEAEAEKTLDVQTAVAAEDIKTTTLSEALIETDDDSIQLKTIARDQENFNHIIEADVTEDISTENYDIKSAHEHLNQEIKTQQIPESEAFINSDVTQATIKQRLATTETPAFTELLSDDEKTDHLLPPSQALQSDLLHANDFDITTLADPEIVAKQSAARQRQGFYVGEWGIMIDFAEGSELTEMPNYHSIPNAPTWFIGITNMHGVVIPIFDLQQFFNISDAASNHSAKEMLLVLQHNEKAMGVVIHGLPKRLAWQQHQQVNHNTSPAILREHIKAACLIDGDLWFDLDTTLLCELIEKSL